MQSASKVHSSHVTMAESRSRSRLKRKSCDEPRDKDCNFRSPGGLHSKPERERERWSDGPSPWWRQHQLTAEDRLWAFTLRSALPILEDRDWDPVPELPQPCAVPLMGGSDERGCRDLCDDVPPFPEPVRPKTAQREVPDQTRLEVDPDDGRPPQTLHKTEEEQENEEQEVAPSKVPAVSFHLQTHLTERSAPPQTEEEHRHKVQGDCRMDASGGASGEGGASGGGILKSCPMCLMVFPDGFTQMDVDRHLCQCLSEMNVDMTW